jgi:hypothetical protein
MFFAMSATRSVSYLRQSFRSLISFQGRAMSARTIRNRFSRGQGLVDCPDRDEEVEHGLVRPTHLEHVTQHADDR